MARGVRKAPPSTDIHPLLIDIKNFVILGVRATGTEERDLSQRQLAVFLTVVTELDEQHTVRGLAAHLNVSKPAITRAIDRLSQFDLVERHEDERDRRSVIITKTRAGTEYLRDLNKLADQSTGVQRLEAA